MKELMNLHKLYVNIPMYILRTYIHEYRIMLYKRKYIYYI